MSIRAVVAAALIGIAGPALAELENTSWSKYQEGDFIIADYKFANGQTLLQLKLHYRTLGSAQRNAAGEIVNGGLLLQGNTGTGANWLRPTLADELFKDGQLLDVGRYFIIIPDALGRGGSSKPSDGLKGKFPHYRYHDMVDSTHRLVTEGRSSAPRHRQFAGLHAQFYVGGDVSRPDGRDRRALLPASRDQWPQPDHAARRSRGDPP
jgi:homoserine O-acetyltransferase/O-succinyltransferase